MAGVTGSDGVGDARVGMEYGVRNVSVGVGARTGARTRCPLTDRLQVYCKLQL